MARRKSTSKKRSNKVKNNELIIVMKYVHFWATEISFMVLLLLSIFALFTLSLASAIDESTRLLLYSLIALGFLFMFLAQNKRHSFEKEIEGLPEWV